MLDPQSLLDQLLGAGQSARGRLDQYSGSGGFARGAAAGGLLGLLLGGKGARRMAGGAAGYAGAAALGALALKAYQNYVSSKSAPGGSSVGGNRPALALSPASLADVPHDALPHAQPAADGSPFQLVLIRAMVAAAKADGHIDPQEQGRLFSEVEKFGLDSEAKAAVFDLLNQPVDLNAIVSAVTTPEQGAEVYLASRLAMDPDHPAERAYLEALALRLKLPTELRAHLDASS